MEYEFSRPVDVSDLRAQEKRLTISARAAELEALAKRFGIAAVESLTAEVVLSEFRGGRGVRLTAAMAAEVVQSCVVTLEPVTARIEEGFLLDFMPAETLKANAEIELDPEGEDPPEPMHGWRIDVGEVVAEQLALALDPYPRHPTAGKAGGLVWQDDEEDVEEDGGPFAALGRLKERDALP